MTFVFALILALQQPSLKPEFVVQNGAAVRGAQLAFAPKSDVLLVGAGRNEEHGASVQVWDTRTLRMIRRIGGLQSIGTIAYSPDGRSVLFDGSEWDTSTWARTRKLPANSFNGMETFSKDGKLVAIGAAVFAYPGFKRQYEVDGASYSKLGLENTIRFSRDGSLLLVACANGVAAFDSKSGLPKWEAILPDVQVTGVTEVADSGRATLSTQTPNGLGVVEGPLIEIDLKSGRVSRRVIKLGPMFGIGSPDSGRELYVQTELRDLPHQDSSEPQLYGSLYRMSPDGKDAKECFGLTGRVDQFALSPDGKTAAVDTNFGHIELYDLKSSQRIVRLPEIDASVRGLDLSPRGDLLLATSGDGAVHVWDTIHWRTVKDVTATAYQYASASFLAGGNLAVDDSDQDLRIFDPHPNTKISESRLGVQRKDLTLASPIAISPSGRYQVIEVLGGRFRVLDIEKSRVLSTIKMDRPMGFAFGSDEAHPYAVTSTGGDLTTLSKIDGDRLAETHTLPFGAGVMGQGNGILILAGRARLSAWSIDDLQKRFECHLPVAVDNVFSKITISPKGDFCIISVSAQNGGAYLCHAGSDTKQLLTWSGPFIPSPAGISDSGEIAVFDSAGALNLFDSTGTFKEKIGGGQPMTNWIPFLDGSGKWIVATRFNQWLIYDRASKKGRNEYFPYGIDGISELRFSLDGSKVTLFGNGAMRTVDVNTEALVDTRGGDFGCGNLRVSPEGKTAVFFQRYLRPGMHFGKGDSYWHARLWNLDTHELTSERTFASDADIWTLGPDNQRLIGYMSFGINRVLANVPFDGSPILETPLKSADVRFLSYERRGALTLVGIKLGDAFPLHAVARSPDGTSTTFDLTGHHAVITCETLDEVHAVLATGSKDTTVILWDLAKHTQLRTLVGHEDEITSIKFSPDGKRLYSASLDGSIRVWNVDTGEQLAALASPSPGEYVVQAGGYYMASRGAAKYIGFRMGDRAYPFDQFDLRLNRPDKVMAALGGDTKTVDLMRNAVEKRLKKVNTTIAVTEQDAQLPTVLLTSPPSRSNSSHINLSVSASHPSADISRVYGFVNDVPVNFAWGSSRGAGSAGLVLSTPSREVNGTMSLELAPGPNKVQVMVETVGGLRSAKETAYILCETPVRKPALYLVAIGVSRYKNSTYNLQSADKDAEGLSAAFSKGNLAFREIHIRTLTNEEATLQGIRGSRSFFEGSSIDDVAILFVAGHGILDKNLDYYFGAHDVDLENPSAGGMSYQELEGLLDGIPARKKLLMMDTCHAGEVDPDLIKVNLAPGVSVHEVKRSVEATKSSYQATDAFLLMQDLFSDPSVGTGTAVLSSSGGAEYAIDGADHGVFTAQVLAALKSKDADGNKDGILMLSALQRYVIEKVYEETRGAQHPVSRRESLEFDFSLWKRS